MFGNQPSDINGWVSVYETGTEYDAELVKGFLDSRDIQCTILNKRDRAYNLNVGDMSHIWLYVPEDQVELARRALTEWNGAQIDVDDFE